MTEVEQPPQNGIDLSAAEDDDSSKARPADIEQDMREMERRKRVEAIMSSKLFREELERIVDSARDGATGILQQLSDIVGVPVSRVGSMFKASSCMMPINDIRGVESMGYAKGEKILRCKLAATFRLLDLYGWTQGLGAQITARLKVDQEYFLVNPYGLLYHEITASALNKVDMQGHIVEQGTTNFGVNKSQFVLHSVVHAARPDIRCAIYIGCSPVVAISSIKAGLLPLTKDACVLGEVTTFSYTGSLYDEEERNRLVRNLGPNSKVMLLTNYGALCCGETIEEAFFAACHIVQACETQLKLLPIGLDNLVLIPEESRKVIYEHSRRPPEDLEKKFAATATVSETTKTVDDETAEKEGGGNIVTITKTSVSPKWRVGGAEFEALMRMLDNAGFRTGYIYRHPLVKSEPPKPKSDVELPPAVSSLGYLLEEEELFRQGIWKKGDLRKGGDRSRWLNSPNVYQKVEVLETGTPDPKKITKWVAEGSPTHSTPVRIEDPLQFVPPNTNPKEFKRVQQQIKENRRADKISAGPQSHILEGVTWDEANRIKDATVSSAGDHVVLVGAASKGIIQRGYQHNATVYKAPYAKNPFDNVTDDELNEYKRTVERKKKSIHGEYTDTDFSESEALSSQQTSGAQQHIKETTTTTTTTTAAVSQSEPEDVSEHHVMRIETQQAPIPSQPEVVLSDEIKIETMHHFQHTLDIFHTSANNYLSNSLTKLTQKYSFLYKTQWSSSMHLMQKSIHLFMIYKIEIYPHYTYPIITKKIMCDESKETFDMTNAENCCAHSSNADLCSSPPYRTLSHYGFNYPITYRPSLTLQPVCLLTPIELQRQKIIAFIKRLNFVDNQAVVLDHKKTGEKIIGKCKPINESFDLETLRKTGSFVSIKEVQLFNKSAEENENLKRSSHFQGSHKGSELNSEHCSSLLSISGTYRTNSQTHSIIEIDQDETENCISTEHYSNENLLCKHYLTKQSRNTTSRKPVKNLKGRKGSESEILGDGYHNHVRKPEAEAEPEMLEDEYHDPHKPEAEQRVKNLHCHYKEDNDNSELTNNKHITLTLNTLKRRAIALNNKNKPCLELNKKTPQRNAEAYTSCVSSNDSSSSAAIEIHINVTVRNSECVKSLRIHEREFKAKLEKVIDDEIHLIVQELENQDPDNDADKEEDEKSRLYENTLNFPSRRLSAPESISVSDRKANPTETDHHMPHICGNSSISSPLCINTKFDSQANLFSLHSLRYRHTLAELEHELETLLNGIIQNMCECKKKVTQISEDIRTSSLHVGPLMKYDQQKSFDVFK
ncbi:protein hu-li tai shao isoform X1 [Glossina fuscipes]|uniref:Protein hu-li tai shao isoform X1 n=1 Tax=Glossina fuscipes TaxID=7396 RepID=A0A9C5Z3L9_9MUSC|nr:protein hu-li tai shao isoform X1 [Glossina fuscipes]